MFYCDNLGGQFNCISLYLYKITGFSLDSIYVVGPSLLLCLVVLLVGKGLGKAAHSGMLIVHIVIIIGQLSIVISMITPCLLWGGFHMVLVNLYCM